MAVLLEASVLPVYVDVYFRPDLLLIIMVVLALRVSYGAGIPLAWFLGVLKDVFSGLYLGLNGISFLVIFMVIKGVSDRLYAESSYLFVITAVFATFACSALNLAFLAMFTKSSTIAYSLLSCLVPHLLFNAFVASLVGLLPLFTKDENLA